MTITGQVQVKQGRIYKAGADYVEKKKQTKKTGK